MYEKMTHDLQFAFKLGLWTIYLQASFANVEFATNMATELTTGHFTRWK